MADLTTSLMRAVSGILLAAVVAMPVFAGQGMVATGPGKVAIKGYDTVAYFTEGQPMKGKSEFAYSWNDAEWHFASAAHRDLFAADPERYAPQFGGFCAMGLSMDKKAVADPTAWTIVDGKLYLKFSEGARDRWRADKTGNIEKAEANWAKRRNQD
ncbi:MAG TPA: YHS domain-containing (seleno)protein [Gammaproteobacteria bacterium]|nr:YHS domain-containing (seleno)protein [Gammaproteobacteria bacterium]